MSAAPVSPPRPRVPSRVSALISILTALLLSIHGDGALAAPALQDAAPPTTAPIALPELPDDADLVDRPVGRVLITGLARLTDSDVRTNIRIAPGQPYDPVTIREDVSTLYRLGQFKTVTAEARREADGTVTVDFVVAEQALILAVSTVGNKVVADEELRKVIPLFANAPRDDYLVEQALRDIKNLYRQKGHFLVEVAVDESRLQADGLLIFKIIEGPRVRIREIVFEGNTSFDARKLSSQLRTKPYFFLFRRGQLDYEQLVDDVATLDRWYRDRGYVDVRVDRRIDLSQDNKEAKVVFVIAEGREYRVRNIEVFSGRGLDPQPLRVFAPEQLIAMLAIQRGDVYAQDLVRKSQRVIEDAYGLLGHVDVRVRQSSVRVGDSAEIDLLFEIREGSPARVGLVRIQGNFLTRDKVIRRETRLQPGRPIDGRELRETEERIRRTRLFGEPIRIAVQDPDPEDQDDEDPAMAEVRDILLEIKERNTGAVNFGAAIGTDSGLYGEVSIRQDNFDITDGPESIGELFAGRAFRGAGQRFSLSLAPGIDVSTFGASLTEPHLFETDISATVDTFYRLRDYDIYDEERLHFGLGFGIRLGDLWSASLFTRYERIALDEIDPDAPIEVVEDEGPNWLSGVGVSVRRIAVDKPLRPSRGNILEAAFEQVGALGGDFSFPRASAEITQFFLIDEDFLGRKSVLRVNARASYIFDDAPLYERSYLGGRSLRGLEFRTVSPKGRGRVSGQVQDDYAIGGNWLFYAGAQYEFPIFGELVTGVGFLDTGTVTDDIAFDPYRVAAGMGVRLYIPQFGPVPLAFDFAFPLVSEDTDGEEVFSFTAELPF